MNLEKMLLENNLVKDTLKLLNKLDINDCIIGGGLLRNSIWNKILDKGESYGINDIDIVYFCKSERDKYKKFDGLEVHGFQLQFRNQAFMHEWYDWYKVFKCEPLESLEDAVQSWSEVCTCVAIGPYTNNRISLPYGGYDLENFIVRQNVNSPAFRLGEKIYKERLNKMDLKK
jgi:hypothetical protein